MPAAARAFFTSLALGLAGCHLLLPYAGGASRDGRATADGPAALPDRSPPPGDGPDLPARREAGSHDDVALLDEGPSPDTPWPSPDSPWLSPDVTSIKDSAVSPCSAGYLVTKTYPATIGEVAMVICTASGGVVHDQCHADQVCNTGAGWHLCTASKFLARGGKSTPAAVAAWLAGCIRAGGSMMDPQDGVCSPCATGALSSEASWACPGMVGAATSVNAMYVGLVSNSQCRITGTKKSANEAMWEAVAAHLTLPASLCCD